MIKLKLPRRQYTCKKLTSTLTNNFSSTFYIFNNKFLSTKKETIYDETQNLTQIYEYKNAVKKAKGLFWAHLVYIYGNSILLYFEIFDPAMGYFHGLMLSLSLGLGWSSFAIIGNILQKTIYKIHKMDYQNGVKLKNPKYRVEYLSFYKRAKTEDIDKLDLVDFSLSNLENFYSVRNKNKNYEKIYVNPSRNIFESNDNLHREFKKMIAAGNL